MKKFLMSGLSIFAAASTMLPNCVSAAETVNPAGVSSAPAVCTPDPISVATVLAASTDELNQMNAKYVNTAIGVTCETVGKGVTQYKFVYRNCGMCHPVLTGTLFVEQDLRPTYADGAPKYTKTLLMGVQVFGSQE